MSSVVIQRGLVSVVMPAYNAASVIAEAICSIRAQTYAHWELLITDDGSTDATAERVRTFSDSRIRLIQQSNQGVSAARNRGLDLARGEFITFLDADDALPPRSLEARVQLLQNNPGVDVVDGIFIVCGSELSVQLHQRFPGQQGLLLPRLLRLDEHVFRNGCFLFRQRLLGRIRFQPGMTHVEDLLFFIRLAAVHHPIYAPVLEATYLYRTGAISAMANLDALERSYFQFLSHLSRIPQLTLQERIPCYLRVSRILLATRFKSGRLLRVFIAAWRHFFLR